MRLEGKVAIITGAGRGIGRAIAERFAAEGAAVIIAEIKSASGQAVAEAIRSRRQTAYMRECDVTKEDQVRSVVDFALQELGQVDILVNNAVWQGDWMHGDSWMAVEVALRGAWNCSRAVLPHMVQRGSGCIVNMSSVQALMGFGADHLYTAAKGAIVSMSRSMACEFGKHNIRINAICPGSTETEHWADRVKANPGVLDDVARLHALGRIAQPAEIANAVLFLASEEASFVTGSTLVVDGGITAGHVLFKEM